LQRELSQHKMVTAKQVINSTKPKITKPPGETQKGSAGYDNIRDDIEKTKSLREGEVVKVPANNFDIVNKLCLDTHTGDANAHHAQSHNIASHSDTSTTGAEVSFLDGTTVTAGKVLFGDGTKITNDTDFHWDNTNKRLGIGTATPAEFLDILDDTNTSTNAIQIKTTGTASNAYIYTDAKGNSGYRMSEDGAIKAYVYWSPTNHLCFYENAANRMVIKDSKVGIGTAAPVTELDIDGDLLLNKTSAVYGTLERSDAVILQFFGYDHDNVGLFFDAGYAVPNMSSGWRSGDVGSNYGIYKHADRLEFVYDSGNAIDAGFAWHVGLVMNTSGNIGMGTNSPNQKLTIEGTMSLKEQASAHADTAAYGQLWVKNTTPCELWFTRDDGTEVQLS
jgi:hypothetical protein